MKFFTNHYEYWGLNAATAGLLIGGWSALLAVAILTGSIPAVIAMLAVSPVFIAFYELAHWYLDLQAFRVIEGKAKNFFIQQGIIESDVKMPDDWQNVFHAASSHTWFKSARALQFKRDVESFYIDNIDDDLEDPAVSISSVALPAEAHLKLTACAHVLQRAAEVHRAWRVTALAVVVAVAAAAILTSLVMPATIVVALGTMGAILMVALPACLSVTYVMGRVAYAFGLLHDQDSRRSTHVTERLTSMLDELCEANSKHRFAKESAVRVIDNLDLENVIQSSKGAMTKEVAEALHQAIVRGMNRSLANVTARDVNDIPLFVNPKDPGSLDGWKLKDVAGMRGNRLIPEDDPEAAALVNAPAL